MARSIATIKAQILANIAADSTLGPLLTSTSNVSIFGLLAFIWATAVAMHEQLLDLFTVNIENIVAAAAPASVPWLQNQVLQFQYSLTNPQVIQLINFAPSYPVVDTTLRLVTQCSVKTDLNGNVRVKVAKGNPPLALASGELSSLQTFVSTIGIPGVNYICISQNSDKIYIQADIYYNGQYSGVISANVIAAITNFLLSLPFDGSMQLSDLEAAIKAVAGVQDVVFNSVVARDDGTAFGGGTVLVVGSDVQSRKYNTIAGYMIPENTVGSTLANSLNFVAQ